MESDEHNEIASGSNIGVRILGTFLRFGCLGNDGGYFDIREKFIQMFEE